MLVGEHDPLPLQRLRLKHLALTTVKLWTLMAVDLLLGVVAGFGILLVTAPDHPTTMQGVIAWTLFVVLVILAVALIALLVIAVRRLRQRKAGHPD